MASLTTSVHPLEVLDDGRRVESRVRAIRIRIVLRVVLDEDEALSLRPQRRDRRLEAGAITQCEARARKRIVGELGDRRRVGDLAGFNAVGACSNDNDFGGVRGKERHDFFQERVETSSRDYKVRVVESRGLD